MSFAMAPRKTVPRSAAPARRGRPRKELKAAIFKLRPDQHEALVHTAIHAKLDGKPNAGEGASLIVRHLVKGWMDGGKRWPDQE